MAVRTTVTESPFGAGFFSSPFLSTFSPRFLITAGLILVVLYLTSLYSFLLFHVLIEIFSVIVAFAIFMFAWNARERTRNGSLLLMGAAYLAVGAIDLLHTLSYEGMGVLENAGADTATQLWIAARYIESVSLAVAPMFARRPIHMAQAVAVYMAVLGLVIGTVFFWPVFPTCFVPGTGLTAFKIVSEYVICTILLVGLVHLARRRAHFDDGVFHMLAASIVLTIIAELMFTFYISVFGISNLVGHFFKLASFWLIYKAIIETGLLRPYALLYRELAQSENRYRDLVETMPTGLCEVDPQGRFTYINPAGLEMSGYAEADLAAGLHLGMVLDAADKDKAQRRIAALFRGSAVESAEYRLLRKDGGRADVIVNSTPVYRDGRFTAVQANFTDVTELNRLQKSLEKARKMESIAILAGGMAHEINNALMAVVGKVELFQLDASKHVWSQADYADLLRGCDRIAELIKRLLAYSRGGRYRFEAVDMAALVPKAIAPITEKLSPEIRIAFRFAPALPKITVDPLQLTMVVSAIVENAVEAIADAGRIEIDLESRDVDNDQALQKTGLQSGRYVRLRVRDTGRGMDQDTLEHIFEPFYTSKFQGRGLGMAAVYGIIKNHGGWVGVDSKPNMGTTVEIYLPVASNWSEE